MSRTAASGKRNRKTGEIIHEGQVTQTMMNEWISRRGVELRGADTDESPHCYKRLDDVLRYHRNTVRILHVLRPVGVAMAPRGVMHPYKD